MELLGKEYGFLLTIGATVQISKICPGNDIKRIKEALKADQSYEKLIENVCAITLALNGGFVASEALVGRKAERLTKEIILALPQKDFAAVQETMTAAIIGGSKGEIKAKPTKKTKKDTTEATA